MRRSAASAPSRQASELRRRQLRLQQPRGLRAGQLEGEQQADARLRHAASCTRRRSTTSWAGGELPAGSSGRARSAPVALRGRAAPPAPSPCTGANRQAHESADRPAPRAEHDAGHRHAGAGLRQRDQRPVPRRPGDRQDDATPSRRSASAPRFGMAYDLTGKQKIVLRGGDRALFFDRARPGNAVIAHAGNPPSEARDRPVFAAAERWAAADLTTQGRADDRARSSTTPSCRSSTEWNGGVQVMLPWATVARRRLRRPAHDYNAEQTLNLNTVDFGTRRSAAAFQDPTLAPSSDPRSVVARGAESESGARVSGLRHDHTTRMFAAGGRSTRLELSFNRRFRDGLQFGFNDAIGPPRRRRSPRTLQHSADGQVVVRADQAQAQDLLGTQTHRDAQLSRGTFVWDAAGAARPAENVALKAVGLDRQRLAALGHLDRPRPAAPTPWRFSYSDRRTRT